MGEVCIADAVTRVDLCATDAVTVVDRTRGPRSGEGPVGATPPHKLLEPRLIEAQRIMGGVSRGWRQVVERAYVTDADGNTSLGHVWISTAYVEMTDGTVVTVAVASHHDDRVARYQLLWGLMDFVAELHKFLAESGTVRVDYESICRPHVIARAA